MEHGARSATPETDSGKSDPVSQVKNLLFRRMLVGIKDGRFFLGNFYCLDKQGNIILQDAMEHRSARRSSPSPMEQRCLGLILIPSWCRTSCHVDCSIEERLSLLSLQESWLNFLCISRASYQCFVLLWFAWSSKYQTKYRRVGSVLPHFACRQW